LEKGPPGSKLKIKIRTVELDSKLIYTALSYTWQTPWLTGAEDQEVVLDEKIVKIRADLHEFLQTIQGTELGEDELWIDAVCIDQKNNDEKKVQIPRSSYIYYDAREVVIWLGGPDQLTTDGILYMDFFVENISKHMEKLTNEERMRFAYDMNWKPQDLYRLLGINPPTKYELESLQHFCRRPWFTRLWIVQEFIMSKERTFVLGHLAITSSVFESFCKFIVYNRHIYDFLLGEYNSKNKMIVDSSYFSMIDILFRAAAWRDRGPMDKFELGVLLRMTDCYTWLVDGIELVNTYLMWVIQNLRGRRATHAQDHIFAGISMIWKWMPEGGYGLPVVDYDKSVEEVYIDFCRHMLKNVRRPVFLTAKGYETTESTHNLPSWVPDFSIRSTMPKSWFKRFTSSGQGEHVAHRCMGTIRDNCLDIPGIYLDTVLEVSDVIENKMTATALLQLLLLARKAQNPPQDPPLKRLIRTLTFDELVAESDPGSLGPYEKDQFIKDLLYTFLPFLQSADLIKQFESDHFSTSEEHNAFWTLEGRNLLSEAAELLQGNPNAAYDEELPFSVRFGSAGAYDRIALSRDRRCLAVVPKKVKAGDELWILCNGALPFVLRRKQETQFEFIGETYVDGYSHGELMEQTTLAEAPARGITLV
jgi:hypothetical protein